MTITHGNLVEKKPAAFEGGVGMFIVQGFFEMFEVLLSYFSNTLSFVRIGAYAVSHAAMMQVVLNWPEWIFWSFVPIGAACMVLHIIEYFVDYCAKSKKDKEEQEK